ncbi:hypothetical protein BGW38_002844 [Lunasporangiospora selenospora]|uniref:RNA polymerase III RPC4-domain-containing protein n=1 Tax=Lunasporangiospora selenospora TaxID=979761 RepID=A0A9P6KD90_9FUNG|nr:hypothetical protein BGW38_002844 [Lunasporangiospora selenospora]
MSEDTGRGSSSSSSNAAGSSRPIGSLHNTTATPAGRLTSLRGGRGGGSKMKFAPTVPAKRNKKDAAPSLLEEARAGADSGRGERGRERGSGRGRGRGRGRGSPLDVVSTASGPFSLGPAALARSRQVASGGGASGAHWSYTGAQPIKMEGGALSGEDREYYGDAAVDMKFGSTTTDASAPTGLTNPNEDDMATVKKEPKANEETDSRSSVDRSEDDMMEGIKEEHKLKIEGPAQELLPDWEEDQMYFFQFPSIMPAFKPRPVATVPLSTVSTPTSSSLYGTPDGTDKTEEAEDGLLSVKPEPVDQDRPILVPDNDLASVKAEPQDTKVSLMTGSEGTGTAAAPGGQRARPKTAAAASNNGGTPATKEELEEAHQLQQEGKIGRLLIYKSGKVKMKVGDVIMDVSSGSECTFLQDLVVIDSKQKQAFVMGTVQKRMICAPNLTQLLNGLEVDDTL